MIDTLSAARGTCTSKEDLYKSTLSNANLKVLSIEALQRAHSVYVEQRVQVIYMQFTSEEQEHLNQRFNKWLDDQPYAIKRLGLTQIYKSIFIARLFISREDLEFEQWADTQGYSVEKSANGYRLK